MTGKQWTAKVLIAIVGVLIASTFIEYVGGAIGWTLAGATLAPMCLPLIWSLYAWSTERAVRAAWEADKG